jgi:hypothetical protein
LGATFLRVLEVISSLNSESEFKSGVGREKTSDLEVGILRIYKLRCQNSKQKIKGVFYVFGKLHK